ncbi:T7SS effector LXG polymorphic toxin [Agathobacter rectalis]|uniref:T7SS effector LXG polymorphic toxin n=1 Tax=Agathobacter rectalis TaxID=39491 RepID=UPI0026C324C4|nr:T7SS effector LXG polymorphic toxin [Agathobacter rectalis]
MEGFQINYTDLSDLFWEYKRKIENLIENIDNCIEKINMFTENAVFTGKTGDAVKSYLGEAHITILSGIKVTAQTLLDNMAAYKDGYRAIDSSTNFKLDEEAIQEFRKKLASNYEDTDEYTGKIRSALSEVSDISDVGMPDSNGVFDIHEQMDSDLIKLVSNVNSYERENVVRLENSVELLLENLQSCLSKIGLSQGAIESYETGSFITGKDAGTLNTGIKIFGDLHEKNKEAYDEIYETEQKIKDEAEKRKTQGIWRTVGGAVLIATGAACIVLTGGAAIPIVADVAVAVGSGTAVFGAADAIEGTQDIYYGSTGDIDSTAVNGIKDDLFQGNEDAYYLTENAFAFAASAMIPIGHASTAGNLTFKSTATIVAKEGISMGAGAGAQKITTDVTGNDTAGMVAGMVASGVTAKGLNGIEAEANKLAKAPKGIDGVTEGAGNVAEDVGKIVESGGKIFKFSDMTESEIVKIVERYRKKAPIEIPDTAKYKAKSMADGYEQISYKWNDGTYKYEVRWHTRTSGAPEGQGNTWVIQRTIPGNGGKKPSTQFLIGENEWVEGWKWYDAISARKNGTATQEQIELLDKGHWKE